MGGGGGSMRGNAEFGLHWCFELVGDASEERRVELVGWGPGSIQGVLFVALELGVVSVRFVRCSGTRRF